jgi:hypothetical protein
MKMVIKILTLCTLHFSLIFGMSPGAPQPPLFVNSNITGPPHQAPLFLTDTSRATIFTQLSFYSPSSIDGKIGVEGTGTVPVTNQDTKNLNWKLSTAVFKAGISVKTWKSLEIFVTLVADSRGNKVSFTGSDFGLSLLICRDQDVRARLDLGYSYVSLDMETTGLRLSDSSYYKVTNNDKGLGPFVSLTMSTALSDWTINPFLQASYCQFPLFSFDWTSDRSISSTITNFTLTPGINYRISNNILIILGVSYIIPSDIENLSSKAFSGFLQANFLL